MSRELDADVAKTVENVVSHLNGKHADTVLFLARRAAGVTDAADAELRTVDRHGVDIAVRQPHGSTTVRLDVLAPINATSDLRLQLRRVLHKARQAAPVEPMTSLESEIASGKPSARHAD
jgi:Protein of unknown function (DUF2470)